MLKVFFTLTILLVGFVSPVYADCDPSLGPCATELSNIVGIIGRIISLLAPAAGIAFFFMLLYGGWQYLTSGGDPKSTGQARMTLTYAAIGIILVVSAWLILTLIKALTGANVTTVTWPS